MYVLHRATTCGCGISVKMWSGMFKMNACICLSHATWLAYHTPPSQVACRLQSM